MPRKRPFSPPLPPTLCSSWTSAAACAGRLTGSGCISTASITVTPPPQPFTTTPAQAIRRHATSTPMTTFPSTPPPPPAPSPIYRQSGTGHTVDCSRLAIAKRAIFDVLDDNNSSTITSADETSLGIRVGYMRYYDCSGDETDGDYNNGCIKVSWGISSKYSRIFCNGSTSCSPTSASSPSVNSESATGGNPSGFRSE